MADAGLALTAIEPLPQGDWLLKIHVVLSDAGMYVEKRRAELLVWSETRQSGSLHYSEACSLRRIWLSPGRPALGVMSKRTYFLGTSAEIDNRQERAVLSGVRRPETPPAAELVSSQWTLIEVLMEGLQQRTMPVVLQPLDVDLGKARVVQIAASTYCSPPARLNALYHEHGLDQIPRGFTVSVCPLESVSEHITSEFVSRVEHVARQRHVNLKVKRTSSTAVSRRLKEMAAIGVVSQGWWKIEEAA